METLKSSDKNQTKDEIRLQRRTCLLPSRYPLELEILVLG